jgi:hypothetical protein
MEDRRAYIEMFLNDLSDNENCYALIDLEEKDWIANPTDGRWFHIGFVPPKSMDVADNTAWQLEVCYDRLIKSTAFLSDEEFHEWLKWFKLHTEMHQALWDIADPAEIEAIIDSKIYDRTDGLHLLNIATKVQLHAVESEA